MQDAFWLTVTVLPAIDMVPTRLRSVLFGAAEKLTRPLPVPLPPLVIASHDSLLLAVQAQLAVTSTLRLPPAELAKIFVGEIVLQAGRPSVEAVPGIQ